MKKLTVTHACKQLTQKELTKAVARYARLHGHFASTVRAVSSLRYAAIKEWREASEKA